MTQIADQPTCPYCKQSWHDADYDWVTYWGDALPETMTCPICEREFIYKEVVVRKFISTTPEEKREDPDFWIVAPDRFMFNGKTIAEKMEEVL